MKKAATCCAKETRIYWGYWFGGGGEAVETVAARTASHRGTLAADRPAPVCTVSSGPVRTSWGKTRAAPPTLWSVHQLCRREMEHASDTDRLFVGVAVAAATMTAAWQPPRGGPDVPHIHDQTPTGHAALQRQLRATGSYRVVLAVTLPRRTTTSPRPTCAARRPTTYTRHAGSTGARFHIPPQIRRFAAWLNLIWICQEDTQPTRPADPQPDSRLHAPHDPQRPRSPIPST